MGESLDLGRSSEPGIDNDRLILGELTLPAVIKHLESQLKDLHAGVYDHLYPRYVISKLIIDNQTLLEEFVADDFGDMSDEAIIALYYARTNEQKDFLARFTSLSCLLLFFLETALLSS